MGIMQRTSNACSNVFDALTDLTNKYDDVVDFMSTIKRLQCREAALLEKSAEPPTVTDGVSNFLQGSSCKQAAEGGMVLCAGGRAAAVER